MNYIMLITYSFDSDYISCPTATREEAIEKLEKYLSEEIDTIETESEYTPIVNMWSDTDVELVYTDDESAKDIADTAYYRVIKIDHNYEKR